MNRTTRSGPPRPTRTRRSVRSLATVLTAATAATASITLGLTSSARADPGDTVVPIGSSQLVQSEDLAAIQLPLDTATVTLGRDTDFSPCLGEGNRWTEVLAGAPRPLTGTWSRRDRSVGLTEHIAQAQTAATARHHTGTLIRKEIQACQEGSSPFDFHYGPSQWSRVGTGTATWALSYRGDDREPDGGVVVFRKGRTFGVVYVHGTFGSTEQTMESVAKVAVHRLT